MTDHKKNGAGVQTVTVAAEDGALRLDKWIAKSLPGLPKGQMYKLMRKGQFRVNGKRVKPDTRVSPGDEVRIPPMPAEAFSPQDTKKAHTRSAAERDADRKLLKSITIYEDKDVMVLNKPHGLATQGGTKVKRHVDALLQTIASDRKQPRLVHRLDRDTSGVLVIAKHAAAAQALSRSFKSRAVQKYYWAVLMRVPKMEDGVIEAKLAKGKAGGGERVIVNDEEGKYSKTEFWVLDRAHRKAAWVCFKPETGRTHQLRVHAQLMNCPILGDGKYTVDDLEHGIEGHKAQDKLHLHARRIILPHPNGRDTIDVSAPMPEHMEATFKYFEFDRSREEAMDEFI